ncbi:MAG: potassium channel family protein [Thermomicrobiales bacterium]
MSQERLKQRRRTWWTLRLRPTGRDGQAALVVTPASVNEPWVRMRGPLLLLLLSMLFGTLGYMIIEGWSLGDSAYMMIITLATIGYGEVRPLSDIGRVFTSILILVGVAVLSYAFTTVMGTFFEGHLTRQWERRRMEKRVQQRKPLHPLRLRPCRLATRPRTPARARGLRHRGHRSASARSGQRRRVPHRHRQRLRGRHPPRGGHRPRQGPDFRRQQRRRQRLHHHLRPASAPTSRSSRASPRTSPRPSCGARARPTSSPRSPSPGTRWRCSPPAPPPSA